MANKPVLSIKSEFCRSIRVALWANPNGYSMTIQKSSKKPNTNDWETKEISLFPSDALALVRAINQAAAYVEEHPLQKEQKGAASGPAGGPPPMPDAQINALAANYDLDDDDIPF